MSGFARTLIATLLALILAAGSSVAVSQDECDPTSPACAVGTACYCCCGAYRCLPPGAPCCALPCGSPTALPLPTPTLTTCHPVVGLTDCKVDADCIVVDQGDCCPCWSNGRQWAINRAKQAELAGQVEVCCAAAGVCPDVNLCRNDVGAACRAGTCTLVSLAATPTPSPTPVPGRCDPSASECTAGTTCGCCCGRWECLSGSELCCEIACPLPTPQTTATPAATPTPTSQVIGIGDLCEPGAICPAPLLCLPDELGKVLLCSCVGDCNGDAEVRIDELVTLVNVALGNQAIAACGRGDADGDGAITVDEIVRALNNDLAGCFAPPPTPTPAAPCSAVPCTGDCVICPPCTPGSICPAAPCRLGRCEADAAGACHCVF